MQRSCLSYARDVMRQRREFDSVDEVVRSRLNSFSRDMFHLNN
jgi:hypothetical protein